MRHHNLFYGSSYDRGLSNLLFLWPDIRAKFPDAELHICYGWDLYDAIFHNNEERQQWKATMNGMMNQPGITHHGRLSKKELQEVRRMCGIWSYPTHFTEINCITALETQADGLVPVTVALAALQETVFSGVMVTGDIYEPEVRDKWLAELLSLMGDEKRWRKESKKAVAGAKDYAWEKIAALWTKEFTRHVEPVKLTVFTPTVRKGWWNIMADNLAQQTYKNFEWIIVDDIGYDRSAIAKQYATLYNLDIKYMTGKPRTKKRTYGLVNANNTALNAATGDLFVFLQDFILIPKDGLEQLAILHKKNPTALIAPVDMYVAPSVKPDIESEDWFHGNLKVIGNFIRQNVRIQNKGLRETTNPFDFEQNYGAIPVATARALGGWYEFYDEGLGYDNTDIAHRAIMKGYKILLDETNVAVCIDHWDALKGNRENVLGRARRLNDPRYMWAGEMMNSGKLPLIRTQAVDDTIDLQYEIPESVKDEDVVKWLKENGPQVTYKWLQEVKL